MARRLGQTQKRALWGQALIWQSPRLFGRLPTSQASASYSGEEFLRINTATRPWLVNPEKLSLSVGAGWVRSSATAATTPQSAVAQRMTLMRLDIPLTQR